MLSQKEKAAPNGMQRKGKEDCGVGSPFSKQAERIFQLQASFKLIIRPKNVYFVHPI